MYVCVEPSPKLKVHLFIVPAGEDWSLKVTVEFLHPLIMLEVKFAVGPNTLIKDVLVAVSLHPFLSEIIKLML